MKNVRKFAAVAAVALAAAGIIWGAVSLTQAPADLPVQQKVAVAKSAMIGARNDGPPVFPAADPENRANRDLWGEEWRYFTLDMPSYGDVIYAKLERPEGTEIWWEALYNQTELLDADLQRFLEYEAQQPPR